MRANSQELLEKVIYGFFLEPKSLAVVILYICCIEQTIVVFETGTDNRGEPTLYIPMRLRGF